jgi:hypothetical protein
MKRIKSPSGLFSFPSKEALQGRINPGYGEIEASNHPEMLSW